MIRKEIPSTVYDTKFLLSDFLEGYQEFKEGRLSVVKNRLLELLDLEKGLKVFEVGIGRGEVLLNCAGRGVEVVGIDYSKDAVDIAKGLLEKMPEAKVLQADCRDLPFKANLFDRVFAGDVIEHMDYEDAITMLKEMKRVLKPGGILLIHTTPNTVFEKFTYPIGKHFLKIINKKAIESIDEHFNIGDVRAETHIFEHNYFSLRKVAKKAGLKGAKVWIDEDLLRSGQHRLTKPFKDSLLIRLLVMFQKNYIIRFFFGNDLWLKWYKK